MGKHLYCKKCGVLNGSENKICPKCGQIQENFKYRNKIIAIIFAVFGGFFGAHKFYLCKWKWGILYLLLSWTLLPWIIAIIESFIFLFTNQEKWDHKYNHGVFIQSKRKVFALLISIIFLIGFFVLTIILVAMPIHKDMDRRVRVNYAMEKATRNLQPIVENFYINNKKFPENIPELNMISEISFPDGGGCRIEPDGRIRIWFDILPELKGGEIWLIPTVTSSDWKIVQWTCGGNIKGKDLINRYLPYMCKINANKKER